MTPRSDNGVVHVGEDIVVNGDTTTSSSFSTYVSLGNSVQLTSVSSFPGIICAPVEVVITGPTSVDIVCNYQPTAFPTREPTTFPTSFPSSNPSQSPTTCPSTNPTKTPSKCPTFNPTSTPTQNPTK